MTMRENEFDYDKKYEVNMGESVGDYTAKTFQWMFLGLLTTFAVAFFGYYTGTIIFIFAIPYVPIVLLVAELAVVLILSARIQKLQGGTARVLFFLYAVLNGVVFSAYFLMYELTSLILIFAMTAAYFGIMAVYGHVTKKDLSRMRPILIGGLLFLIACGLLSLFLPLGDFERIVCLIGIAVFLGFTAYDTQKIRTYYHYYQGDQAMLARASIFSALQLYLDFINLFLYLLRLLGRAKK